MTTTFEVKGDALFNVMLDDVCFTAAEAYIEDYDKCYGAIDPDERDAQKLTEFDRSLLALVMVADAKAKINPPTTIPNDLQWVPEARKAVARVDVAYLRDSKHNIQLQNIFAAKNSIMQKQLYAEMQSLKVYDPSTIKGVLPDPYLIALGRIAVVVE